MPDGIDKCMDKDKFEKHLKEEEAIRTEEQKATLSYLETELEISPIDNPYDYVKELQSRFDNSGIEYSDEYYDVLGIDHLITITNSKYLTDGK